YHCSTDDRPESILVYCSLTRLLHTLLFLHDAATTEISTLSLHDALPISFDHEGFDRLSETLDRLAPELAQPEQVADQAAGGAGRSEEHTSELQSLTNLVCRLLLEQKEYCRKTRMRAYPAHCVLTQATSGH